MARVRSDRWSRVLLTVGGAFIFLAGLVGFLNAAVVDGARFAELANEVRQDDQVKAEIGRAIGTAAIDANPDLIAIEPALDAGAAAIVGSPILDGAFTTAVRSFHAALTEEGSTSAVLSLADLGATVTTALDRFVPQAAELIPDDLNLTLAEIGGQGGLAARIIPVVSVVTTLTWLLPLVAVVLLGLGVWLAPSHRISLVRMGWILMAAGGFLGLAVAGMAVAGWLVDDSTLTGALLAAALRVFSEPLALRFIATVLVGGLIVVAAGALLPQVDLRTHIRAVGDIVTRRPANPVLAVVRALLVIAVGALIVLFPGVSAQAVAVIAGLVVFFMGVTELDVVAERSRARERAEKAARAAAAGPVEGEDAAEEPGPRSALPWAIPAVAGVAGLVVVAAIIVPQHLPRTGLQTASVDSEACNGHVELCDRPFDQVVFPATHNSMSVADGTWFLAEQPKDMVESLDDGIRGLLVDTWYGQPTDDGGAQTADRSIAGAEQQLREAYGEDVVASVRRTIDRVRRSEPVGPPEPYFCHTVCEIGATPMLPVMRRLNTWLEAHPRDVVVLFIQDTVTPADTAEVLDRAGLAEKAYTHPDGAAWPTLREMIEADTRLLVLMENTGGGAEHPWLHQGFDLVQDTEYTFKSAADFDCALKRGSADNPLLSVNHWLASFTALVSSAEQVNAYEVLEPRIAQCVEERGRVPWMIAVNWYDRGDLFRVVEEYNGVAG